MQELVPDIRSDVPIPSRATRTLPEINPNEEIRIRATTIKMLADLKGEPISPNVEQQVEAETLAHEMIKDPKKRPEFSKYSNEAMAYLAGMVQQSNVQLVDELSELKMYVINKLIHEVEHAATAKDRLVALKNLGEVDGVDAFKKRSELTVKVQPIEEVEMELKSILEGITYEEAEYEEVEEIEPEDDE